MFISYFAEIRGKFYSDFLSLLWLYFVNGLCKPQVPNDVVAIYNMEFVKLPWQQLMPNMHVMESMAMVGIFCMLGNFQHFLVVC